MNRNATGERAGGGGMGWRRGVGAMQIDAYDKAGFTYPKTVGVPDEEEPEYLMRIGLVTMVMLGGVTVRMRMGAVVLVMVTLSAHAPDEEGNPGQKEDASDDVSLLHLEG